MALLQIESLVNRIRAHRQGLTRAEQSLASYVAAHGETLAFWSAERLGQEVGVSDSTVVRFARTLGFDSYSDLQGFVQREVSRMLQRPAPSRLRQRSAALDGRGPLWESFQQDLANVETTLLQMDARAFDAAVTALIRARSRFILGLRGSAALAIFLSYNLRGLLPGVRLVSYGIDNVLDEVVEVGEGDVVLAFGFSRTSLRTVQFARLARERGAQVIAVVNDHLSPLAEAADHVFWINSESRAFTPSFTAGLGFCQALLTAVGDRVLEQAEPRLSEIERILVGHQVFAPDPLAAEPADEPLAAPQRAGRATEIEEDVD